jgi:hypothetical protein
MVAHHQGRQHQRAVTSEDPGAFDLVSHPSPFAGERHNPAVHRTSISPAPARPMSTLVSCYFHSSAPGLIGLCYGGKCFR